MTELKKTPLHAWHVDAGATMTDFNGWHMPLLMKGMTEEHLLTRNSVGIFDLCHMGRVMVRGSGSIEYLNKLTPAFLDDARPGQVLYSFLLNEEGRTMDDITIYVGTGEHLVVVNASNHDRDIALMTKAAASHTNVQVDDYSTKWGMVAVQGPSSDEVMHAAGLGCATKLEYYHHVTLRFAGAPTIVSSTGYTGELGYEIYLPWSEVPRLWEKLISASASLGGGAVGLGARDTLRLEASMPLYGHELSEETTPLEAGLSKFINFDKPGFVGRDALLALRDSGGAERRLVCLEMMQRGPVPRQEYAVCAPGVEDPVGVVTSGAMSPSLQKNIAMAYVARNWARIGTNLEFEIRGRRHPAVVVKRPFFKRSD